MMAIRCKSEGDPMLGMPSGGDEMVAGWEWAESGLVVGEVMMEGRAWEGGRSSTRTSS